MVGSMCAGERYPLNYRMFGKDQRVANAAITENERLGEVAAYIKERQDQDRNRKQKPIAENGYKPTGRKPRRNTGSVNNQDGIARRRAALAGLDAAE